MWNCTQAPNWSLPGADRSLREALGSCWVGGRDYSRVTRSKHFFSSGFGLTWHVSKVSFTGGRFICAKLGMEDVHVTLWASQTLRLVSQSVKWA